MDIVLPSLVYPYFKLGIDQDAMRKPLLILASWSKSHRGRLLENCLNIVEGCLLDKRRLFESGRPLDH